MDISSKKSFPTHFAGQTGQKRLFQAVGKVKWIGKDFSGPFYPPNGSEKIFLILWESNSGSEKTFPGHFPGQTGWKRFFQTILPAHWVRKDFFKMSFSSHRLFQISADMGLSSRRLFNSSADIHGHDQWTFQIFAKVLSLHF